MSSSRKRPSSKYKVIFSSRTGKHSWQRFAPEASHSRSRARKGRFARTRALCSPSTNAPSYILPTSSVAGYSVPTVFNLLQSHLLFLTYPDVHAGVVPHRLVPSALRLQLLLFFLPSSCSTLQSLRYLYFFPIPLTLSLSRAKLVFFAYSSKLIRTTLCRQFHFRSSPPSYSRLRQSWLSASFLPKTERKTLRKSLNE